MSVYTYMGNKDPHEHTEEIILRNGALKLKLFGSQDLTVGEVEVLDDRYFLVPGVVTPDTPGRPKAALELDDLENVDTTGKTQGSTLAWREDSEIWEQTNALEMVAYTNGVWPPRPDTDLPVIWVGPSTPPGGSGMLVGDLFTQV